MCAKWAFGQYDLVLYQEGAPKVLPVTGAIESRVEMNNQGVIGFYGVMTRAGVGVRTYANGATTDVLGSGDILFGKQCTIVSIWDINEKNQLALTVQFSDGSSAVVVATPVPEPSTHISLMIAAAMTAVVISSNRASNRPFRDDPFATKIHQRKLGTGVINRIGRASSFLSRT